MSSEALVRHTLSVHHSWRWDHTDEYWCLCLVLVNLTFTYRKRRCLNSFTKLFYIDYVQKKKTKQPAACLDCSLALFRLFVLDLNLSIHTKKGAGQSSTHTHTMHLLHKPARTDIHKPSGLRAHAHSHTRNVQGADADEAVAAFGLRQMMDGRE